MTRLLLCEHLGNLIQHAGCACPRKDGYVCTIGKGIVQPAGLCETCREYVPKYMADGQSATRHLAYHVYPVRGNRAAWQWNLTELMRHIKLFNGMKLVYVVQDALTDDVSMVRDFMADDSISVRGMKNDKVTAEVSTWVHAWSSTLTHLSGNLFWGHAKGVTHHFDPSSAVIRWTKMMYESLLDYYPLVEQKLEEHETAGSFTVHGKMFPKCAFHYSGTFFWSRIDRVKSKAFEVPWFKWGVEAWPGRHFNRPGTVFYEGVGLNLYDAAVIETAEQTFDTWRQRHRMEETEWTTEPRSGQLSLSQSA